MIFYRSVEEQQAFREEGNLPKSEIQVQSHKQFRRIQRLIQIPENSSASKSHQLFLPNFSIPC